ncbi:Eukaryotic translation initiation factor 3 subunit H [Vanrija pseudolonga]|uniref:Eukaryotic translation initiation factor 3 subunit H n=1 Tax=Vanrija pseudolonga TaxID=143232 RepID=A0AAF1BRI8_9TREE|nr:Eukaryotic translation initiation factor 3 subunit H [Vanrija pseudolonga]
MTSMAAAIAASLPAQTAPTPAPAPAPAKVPARMEGFLDVEAARDVESVKLSSLVFLKVLKHSTDSLPAPPPQTFQQDRNAPPPTNLSSHPDALGVFLGLDLDGVMEVEDSFALPAGETSLGAHSYSNRLLGHLREVQTPDSPVGVYLSTHNGGFVTRGAVDLMVAVEKAAGRGKAILVIHDAGKAANSSDLSIKAYKLSEGAQEAAKSGKWDVTALAENKLTAATMLTPLPLTVSSPALINAFLATLTTPATTAAPSLSSPAVPLPPTFLPLVNPLPHSLPEYLSNTLDGLTLHTHEANNLAFMTRQIAREKAKHEQTIKEREEENARRRKANQPELPAISAEIRGGTKEPSRLEMLCLQGQVDGLAKSMGAEAGKGLVRCYL